MSAEDQDGILGPLFKGAKCVGAIGAIFAVCFAGLKFMSGLIPRQDIFLSVVSFTLTTVIVIFLIVIGCIRRTQKPGPDSDVNTSTDAAISTAGKAKTRRQSSR